MGSLRIKRRVRYGLVILALTVALCPLAHADGPNDTPQGDPNSYVTPPTLPPYQVFGQPGNTPPPTLTTDDYPVDPNSYVSPPALPPYQVFGLPGYTPPPTLTTDDYPVDPNSPVTLPTLPPYEAFIPKSPVIIFPYTPTFGAGGSYVNPLPPPILTYPLSPSGTGLNPLFPPGGPGFPLPGTGGPIVLFPPPPLDVYNPGLDFPPYDFADPMGGTPFPINPDPHLFPPSLGFPGQFDPFTIPPPGVLLGFPGSNNPSQGMLFFPTPNGNTFLVPPNQPLFLPRFPDPFPSATNHPFIFGISPDGTNNWTTPGYHYPITLMPPVNSIPHFFSDSLLTKSGLPRSVFSGGDLIKPGYRRGDFIPSFPTQLGFPGDSNPVYKLSFPSNDPYQYILGNDLDPLVPNTYRSFLNRPLFPGSAFNPNNGFFPAPTFQLYLNPTDPTQVSLFGLPGTSLGTPYYQSTDGGRTWQQSNDQGKTWFKIDGPPTQNAPNATGQTIPWVEFAPRIGFNPLPPIIEPHVHRWGDYSSAYNRVLDPYINQLLLRGFFNSFDNVGSNTLQPNGFRYLNGKEPLGGANTFTNPFNPELNRYKTELSPSIIHPNDSQPHISVTKPNSPPYSKEPLGGANTYTPTTPELNPYKTELKPPTFHTVAPQTSCNETVDTYKAELFKTAASGWHPPKPATHGLYTTVLHYEVGHDSQIHNMRVVQSSGDPRIDNSAIDRVNQLQGSYKPFPDCFAGNTLGVDHTFKVNYH